jgi:hypothetical protein
MKKIMLIISILFLLVVLAEIFFDLKLNKVERSIKFSVFILIILCTSFVMKRNPNTLFNKYFKI